MKITSTIKILLVFTLIQLLTHSIFGQLKSPNIKIAIFPVTFTDVPTQFRNQFPTKEKINSIIFNSDSNFQQYFKFISYNTLQITGDVFDYTLVDKTVWTPGANLPISSVLLQNVNLNAPANFNIANYDYIVILIGHDAQLGQSIAYSSFDLQINGKNYLKPTIHQFFHIGYPQRDNNSYPFANSFTGKNEYLLPVSSNKYVTGETKHPLSSFEGTYIHEFIHIMGIFAHANSRTNNGYADYEPEQPNNSNFYNNEYGNKYDLVGTSSGYTTTLNGYFRRVLNLITDDMLEIVNTSSTKKVTIQPLNGLQGKRLIAVYLPNGYIYTLEIRTDNKFDPFNSFDQLKGNLEGFFVYKNNGLQNLLLDMSPTPNGQFDFGSYYNINDVVLKPGMVYENSEVRFSNVIKNSDGSFTVTIQIKNQSTSINNLAENEDNVQIFPNPTQSFLSLNAQSDISDIKIFNTLGQVMMISSLTTNPTIDVSGLVKGLYYISFIHNEKVVVKPFVKQ